jgi:ATP/maltotriose-dependent transcriptional regulator MalT
VLTTFINELAQFEHRGVLVLEDYHVITSPQIHETVTFFPDHLPATLHLAILTRSDPPLPLASLCAHDDLYELHAADLRFSLEETQAFLRQALPFPLEASAILRLEARTEGWVAGLRLLSLALQQRKDPQDLEYVLTTFTDSHRHILEYLVADVLSSQPEPVQEFLLQMAENYWRAGGNRHKLGELLALRSQVAFWQADLPQAFVAARQALEWLPADEMLWRGSSMLTVGVEELLAGKPDEARQATLEARGCFEVSGNIYGTRATALTLGEVPARQGELHQAAQLYRQVLVEAGEDPVDRGVR